MLVGRPNVGKSTLFNRVCGSRRAIVTPVAGTTRDVIRASSEWQGTAFELVDTGGMFGASTDPLQAAVSAHGERALDGAHLIIVLVDGRDGPVPADRQIADRARRCGAPMILAVNKVDDHHAAERVEEFHALGIAPLVSIAAEHGLGIGDLLDAVTVRLPDADAGGTHPQAPARSDEVGVAIIGRPNVGKSSLVNVLARADRMLVSDMAGTTRDAVDTMIRWHGRRVRLVDTAGIRRPGRVAAAGQVESVSVTVARRAIARADVAVLVVDASSPLAKQDAVIAGAAEKAGCGIVIAANKWDLVERTGEFAKQFDEELRDVLKFADFAPIVHLSALTGARAPKLVETVLQVAKARAAHVATADVNRLLERAVRRNPPRSPGKREVKIYYGTQVATRPPQFVVFTNVATRLHFSYERFLKNRLRESFDFFGTPIRLKARARRPPARRR
ncbi:MAG: ribosome biogenesis GTPase Der [Acidobacteria bacterium]|nr:ribosome biogenesis GTPase Der [Acidobacteriota bacterium]